MLEINGLTQYQVEMLDHMWSLDTMEEYFQWYDLLDEDDQKLADTLQKMILLATVDDMLEDCTEAKQVLNKFALQKP